MDKDVKSEIKSLKKDMLALQDDLKDLTRAIRDGGSGRFDDARERLRETAADIENRIKKQMSDTYDEVRDLVAEKGRLASEAGREQLEKNPLATIITAFFGGFILSRLFWKR